MMRCIFIVAILQMLGGNAFCVILENSGDPEANTSSPPAPYENAGWQLQGRFGAFSGTPIAKNLFITARHIGGGIGDRFILDGVPYRTIAYYPDPESDLILWKVEGEFPFYAKRASQSPTIREDLVIFGRGTTRGAEIRVPEPDGQLRGWKWGPADGRLRWGTNRIASYLNAAGKAIPRLDPDVHWILCYFNQGETTHECHLSRGDSGGGIFAEERDGWKLFAINYAVSGPYRHAVDSAGFEGSLMDTAGLFIFQDNSWTQIPRSDLSQPGFFLATAISSRNSWIESIRQPLESGKEPIFISSAQSIGDSFIPVEFEYEVSWTDRVIQIPVDGDQRFYNISSPADFKYSKFKLSHTHISIYFE